MCDHSNDPGGKEAAMVTVFPGVWCDPCIAPLVKALNESDDLPRVPSRLNPDGVTTVASCCGHGKRPGHIALADGRWLTIHSAPSEPTEVERLRKVIDQAALDLGTESGKTPEDVYRDLVAALPSEPAPSEPREKKS